MEGATQIVDTVRVAVHELHDRENEVLRLVERVEDQVLQLALVERVGDDLREPGTYFGSFAVADRLDQQVARRAERAASRRT